MADTKAIANRIKSVRDTRKITNAMYLIASTKLRKSRSNLENTLPFFDALKGEIGKIVRHTHVHNSKYFIDKNAVGEKEGTVGILVITADKGLAGAYNQNVIKETLRMIEQHPDYRLFVVGEYGKHYFLSHNIAFDEGFDFPDHEPSLLRARMIAGYIMDLYDNRKLSQVHIVYTNFKNALTSEVTSYRLVPFEREHFTGEEDQNNLAANEFFEDQGNDEILDFEYIPSPFEVMERCIPVYCIGIIYSVMVYSFCCEQNDRMMAMDSANQNADKLLGELTVKFNHLRQNGITQEITEISASVKASQKS